MNDVMFLHPHALVRHWHVADGCGATNLANSVGNSDALVQDRIGTGSSRVRSTVLTFLQVPRLTSGSDSTRCQVAGPRVDDHITEGHEMERRWKTNLA
jgi:hypothetical protein